MEIVPRRGDHSRRGGDRSEQRPRPTIDAACDRIGWVTDQPSSAPPDGEAITPEGLDALKAELGELETAGRRQIAARILTAREHGDLSENAEYHAAKEDQAHLETRIQRLQRRLRNAVVVESSPNAGIFAFGLTAEIRDEATGDVQTWTIVGPTEADRAIGKISAESPVAKALLGHAPGETVEVQTPRGIRRLRIERLV
jgi:transcription elongation factor GreA